MATTVINIHSGARYDQYIGRAGRGYDGYFGNPFRLQPGEPRGATLARYRVYFLNRVETDPEFRRRVLALRGKVLGCFCHPNPCHGHIIANWIDNQPTEIGKDTLSTRDAA